MRGPLGSLPLRASGRLPHALSVVAVGLALVAPGAEAAAPTDTIRSVAGTGAFYDAGDGDAATEAGLTQPRSVAELPDGTLLVASPWTNRIRSISRDGTIGVAAGNGRAGFGGDGGPASEALLNFPHGAWPMPDGGFVIADTLNHRIRRVSPSGVITTVAGNGFAGYSGDGGPATAAAIDSPRGVAVLADGSILFPDTNNHRVRKVSPSGVITTVAGTGAQGFSGDGGAATSARLSIPFGVAPTAGGGFLVVDVGNQRVREVSADGTIATVAGDGTAGFSGDGGPATSASLFNPHAAFATPDGGFVIADASNQRIREVDAAGTITTVAGDGTKSFGGDGGPAAAARLDSPKGVWLSADGVILVADEQNGRVRAIGAPVTPVSASPPRVMGVPAQGRTLTAVAGGWTGSLASPGPVLAYRWQRCDAAGEACAPIPDAGAKTYRARSGDVGGTLRVEVTASTGPGLARSVISAPTAVVSEALVGPANVVPPSIEGVPRAGVPLVARVGAWSGTAPLSYSYRWQRCAPDGGACVPVLGAVGQTYVPGVEDVGSSLRVRVVASNAAGSSAHQALVGSAALSHWRLGDLAGPADDIVGGRNGIYVNLPTRAAPGLLNTDLDGSLALFDGQGTWGQYVEVPGSVDWAAAPFTVELVVSASLTPANRTLWSVASDASPFRGWWLNTDPAGRPRLFLGDGTAWRWDPASTAAPLAPGETHHLVATYDGARGRLYVDGQLVSTVGDAPPSDPPVVLAAPPAATPMRIGAFVAATPSASQFWPGRLDEAAFYGSALDATAVAAHAAAAVSDAGALSAASAGVTEAASAPPGGEGGGTGGDGGPAPPELVSTDSVPPDSPAAPPQERRRVFVTAGANDGTVSLAAGGRGRAARARLDIRGTRLVVARSAVGSTTVVSSALLRFDTTALPAGARITSVTLLLRSTGRRSDDRRALVIESYLAARWPIDARDFARAPARSPLRTVLLRSLRIGRVLAVDLPVQAVSTSSGTAFRLRVDGKARSGRNAAAFASGDQRRLAVPRLVVTYVETT